MSKKGKIRLRIIVNVCKHCSKYFKVFIPYVHTHLLECQQQNSFLNILAFLRSMIYHVISFSRNLVHSCSFLFTSLTTTGYPCNNTNKMKKSSAIFLKICVFLYNITIETTNDSKILQLSLTSNISLFTTDTYNPRLYREFYRYDNYIIQVKNLLPQ